MNRVGEGVGKNGHGWDFDFKSGFPYQAHCVPRSESLALSQNQTLGGGVEGGGWHSEGREKRGGKAVPEGKDLF